MRDNVKLLIESIPLLERIGPIPNRCRKLVSDRDANYSIISSEFSDFLTTAHSELSIRGCSRASDVDWDLAVEEVQDAMESEYRAIVEAKVLGQKLDEVVAAHVVFHFGLIALEQMFKMAVGPVFHLPYLLPVYRSGYIVCGWEGLPLQVSEIGEGDSPIRLPSGDFLIF